MYMNFAARNTPVKVLQRLMLGLAAFVLWVPLAQAQQTRYVLNNTAYTTAVGSYTTAMRASGYFETAQPLPPNLTNVAIGPGAPQVYLTNWNFNDGAGNVYTPQTSFVQGIPSGIFAVSTDASGNLLAADVHLLKPLPPNTVGQAMPLFVTLGASVNVNGDTFCIVLVGNVCSLTGSGPPPNNAQGPITWTAVPLVQEPIPTLSEWALVVTTAALMLAAFRALRRRA